MAVFCLTKVFPLHNCLKEKSQTPQKLGIRCIVLLSLILLLLEIQSQVVNLLIVKFHSSGIQQVMFLEDQIVSRMSSWDKTYLQCSTLVEWYDTAYTILGKGNSIVVKIMPDWHVHKWFPLLAIWGTLDSKPCGAEWRMEWRSTGQSWTQRGIFSNMDFVNQFISS